MLVFCDRIGCFGRSRYTNLLQLPVPVIFQGFEFSKRCEIIGNWKWFYELAVLGDPKVALEGGSGFKCNKRWKNCCFILEFSLKKTILIIQYFEPIRLIYFDLVLSGRGRSMRKQHTRNFTYCWEIISNELILLIKTNRE